jgi:DNA modification methylase
MILSEREFEHLPEHLRSLFRKRANPAKDEVLAAFPSTGVNGRPNCAGEKYTKAADVYGEYADDTYRGGYMDSGSVARFFYSAKASKADRALSKHPTVKPVKLMQWLVRLITPPNGTVLDCFAGTGTTGEAAWREGFSAVLIEREEEYQADIERRMLFAKAKEKPSKATQEPETLPLPLDSEVAYQTTLAAE